MLEVLPIRRASLWGVDVNVRSVMPRDVYRLTYPDTHVDSFVSETATDLRRLRPPLSPKSPTLPSINIDHSE